MEKIKRGGGGGGGSLKREKDSKRKGEKGREIKVYCRGKNNRCCLIEKGTAL